VNEGPGPLHDIRIVAVSEYGAGPFSTQLFADYGADVIKVENPKTRGDSGRRLAPFQEGDDSLFFQTHNRNMRSVALDLSSDAGRDAFNELVKSADVVFNNRRAGAARRLGLTYESLGAIHPSVVCCTLSGWGLTSPRADDRAYDYVLQAFGGQMALTGEPGGLPTRPATPWIDTSTAFAAAFGMLAAVHGARRSGLGCDVDVSMVSTSMVQWMYLTTWYMSQGYVPQRTTASGHPSVVPVQLFATADGHMVVLCQTQAFWEALCRQLDRRDLLEDPRFTTVADRRANKDDLIAILTDVFTQRSNAEWVTLLGAHLPVEPVNSFPDAVDKFASMYPQQVHTLDHPTFGEVRVVANPVRFSTWQPRFDLAPGLGEHTDEVLREVGYDDEDLARLHASGATTLRTDAGGGH
jgi:crotonobetainyl-CoA:carnitine CoA-transferase CaiB-like acyl-CoA transferase